MEATMEKKKKKGKQPPEIPVVEKLVSAPVVSKALGGVSIMNIHRMAKCGKIRSYSVGETGHDRFRISEVLEDMRNK